jgi:SAM-dependent methyltransferase
MPSESRRPADGSILTSVASYYTERLGQFGTTARGVDWKSEESQELRFRQLLRVFDDVFDGQDADQHAERTSADEMTLIDYGCGYGALVDYLLASGVRRGGEAGAPAPRYVGFDISAPMIDAARARHAGRAWCAFTTDPASLRPADVVVASGIFNVKLDHPIEAWRVYMLDTLDTLHALSTRAFAFNVLSMASDPEKRRADLFYADAGELFARCQQRYSRRVALLHDTPLYELTIIVRK